MADLILIAIFIGIPAVLLMKRCLASLDRLDYACEKHFAYRVHTFKAWAFWLVSLLSLLIPILGPIIMWLFLRNLITKTSPAVAWRVILLYLGITICSFTILAIVAGIVAELHGRQKRRDTFYRRLDSELKGLHDIDRVL